MPHITLDYAPRLAQLIDMQGLCDHIRRAAIDTGTGILPMAGVRVRAFAADYISIADGNPDHMYLDISVRLRGGRPLEARKAATQQIFDAARAFLAPAMETHPIALSLEMRDIDPELSPKCGTIRDHLSTGDPA